MADLEGLSIAFRANRRELDRLAGEESTFRRYEEELKAEVLELTQSVLSHDRATVLLNSLGEEKQYAAQEAIEQLVTRGLQTIFDESLSFHILQDVKAKRAEVSFIVRSKQDNGSVVDTPVMSARGGGLAVTIGFLLRLVVMMLKDDPNKSNVIVLDETFSHVSEEYLPALGEFLQKISQKTDVQLIMVTHQPEFMDYADKVYRISLSGEKSVVKEMA